MNNNRKDLHLEFAKKQGNFKNDFDKIRLIHHSLPSGKVAEIDLSVTILNRVFPYPFYINSMTGGTKKSHALNLRLAKLADHFNLPFFLGSMSPIIKDENLIKDHKLLRKTYPNLFIVANINPNFSVEMALKAVEAVNANALAIHLNPIQELVNEEGDRDFTHWEKNILAIQKAITIPIIIKEVGFGLDTASLLKLREAGFKYFDISGQGGTNFAQIELALTHKTSSPLSAFGISTVEALLKVGNLTNIEVYASGGIRNAADILKAMALGAKATGMAHYFLNLLKLTDEEMIIQVNRLIEDLKKICLLLNIKKITEVNSTHLYISPLK